VHTTLLHDTVLEDRLRRHVERLAGEIGERNVFQPQALHAAEVYIRDVWSRLDHEIVAQEYLAAGVRSANLEITLPGHNGENVVVVGAHYDTVTHSPGADDNASAVAVLLELGRLLHHASPNCTLRLVAFVNEESPFFFTHQQGSRVYAQAARRRGDPIRFMVSLEMLGYYRDTPGSQQYPPVFRWFYPDRADFIALVSNFRSRREMRRLASAFRAVSRFPLEQAATFAWIPGVAWSDHLSFWREGYRAMMLTDTAFFRNPHYHAATDKPETLDYPRMAALTEGLAAALTRLS
jgi:Zn-dependent M28 family amino/carboxypeptidase